MQTELKNGDGQTNSQIELEIDKNMVVGRRFLFLGKVNDVSNKT